MSVKSLKKIDQLCWFSSGIGSSQSSFGSVPHKRRKRIFALTVSGPANPKGSYTLLICNKIIRFVSCWGFWVGTISLLDFEVCFCLVVKLNLTSKHY